MAKHRGNHVAPSRNRGNRAAPSRRAKQRKSPLPRIVIGCVAVLVLIAVGIVTVRHFSGQTRAAQTQQSDASANETSASTDTSSSSKKATKAKATSAKEDSTKEEKTTTPATVEVMMVGDVLMHDEIVDSGWQGDGSYYFGFVFDNIKDYIDAADVRILNQETVMGDPSNGYHLYMGAVGPIMNTPTALADTEVDYGFNVILKATNHTYDLGYAGLGHELDYWKANYPNMPVLGVNNPNAATGDTSQDYVNNVYVFEKNGMKIAILNYTWATNENISWDTDSSYISYMSEEKIREDVKKARDAGAEMIIACPHWGIEYDTEPSDEEDTYSKLFTELGVDVILGAHPHILQPIELLQNEDGHKTVCFYSVGNYIAASLMQNYSLIGGIARVTLQRDAKGNYSVSDASLVPTVICKTYGPNMSAFPIYEWTDDLAAQSIQSDTTVDYVYSFCSDLYGNAFDAKTGIVTLDLDDKPRTV